MEVGLPRAVTCSTRLWGGLSWTMPTGKTLRGSWEERGLEGIQRQG